VVTSAALKAVFFCTHDIMQSPDRDLEIS